MRQGRTFALLGNACGRDTLHPCRKRQRGLRPTPRQASCRWTTFEKGASAMAIYHLAVKSVSRSTGRSAVAAVAYRAGVCLENERDGLVHDRSEEHTYELQSLMRISYAVFCLKKKKKDTRDKQHHTLHK